MKIPTIKKINKEFDKTVGKIVVLESGEEWYNSLEDILLEEMWGKKIKQFYQDEILKILGYLDMEDKEAKGDISSTIGCALDVGMLAGWNRAVKELKKKIERIKK